MLCIAIRFALSRSALLLQDRDPNNLARDLVAVADLQIVIQVPLAVEPNDATVVVAAPVLRVDTYQHPSRSHSIYPALQIVAQMLISSSTS